MQNRRPGGGGGCGINKAVTGPNSTAPTARLQDLTDSTLADLFVARAGGCLRYFPPRRWWLLFDGTSWHHDDTDAVFDACRQLLRELSVQYPAARERLGRASTIAAVLRVARTDREVVVPSTHAYSEMMRTGR